MLALAPSMLAVPAPVPLHAPIFNAPNVTECLEEHCNPQLVQCTKDAKCEAGIKCVLACPAPPTAACVDACLKSNFDQAMLEVGLCAESAHCIAAVGVRSLEDASSEA